MSRKKLIVIGGGAAGFFCAINAARLNKELSVVLIEKTNKLLSKVKVSGGGRMSKKYPRGGNFVKKAFHQFFTTDTISWFKERGVELKAEGDGRMFPVTNSSQTIIDCLMKEANKHAVEVMMSTEVKKISVQQSMPARPGGGFNIQFSNGKDVEADYLCIASGGYPKSSMFEWLRELGLSIEEPVPSLFTFNMPGHPIRELMGVSVENARVRITGTKLEQEGPLLITHWGMSGPAILKLSAWGARELAAKSYDFKIMVNWLPEYNEQQLAEKFQSLRLNIAAQKITNKNPFGLPGRLWEFLVTFSEVNGEKRWADLPAKEANKLIKNLCNCEFDVRGKTTFKEEFVTAGGIKLNEIDHNTMMSKKVSNLFFAGEVMDIDGVTGGFNFQHAWTSGFISGKTIAQSS